MLFPYNRLYDLFHHIRQNNFSPSAKLSSALNVSERTIRSDIALINDVLSGYGAVISLKRKYGYYLEVLSSSDFSGFLKLLEGEPDHTRSLDSQESRVFHLTELLLNAKDYLKADFLAEQVYISRVTLVHYLKLVTVGLESYGLELISKSASGYKIIGTERDKRSCLSDLIFRDLSVDTITAFTRDEIQEFPGLDLMLLKSVFSEPLMEADIRISELNLKKLVLLAAITISRIQLGFSINLPEDIVWNAPMEELLDCCLEKIHSAYDTDFTEDEKKYLYLHLVSSCDYNAQIIDSGWLNKLVAALVETIYKDFSIDFRADDIFSEDLTRHLRSILKAKALNIKEKNPMLSTIKSHFPLPFEIALTSVRKAFEGSGYHLTEDDIAYIALHIGAALERFLAGRREKKKVLLLCGLGLSAARMLETMLQKYFKDTLTISHDGFYTSFSQLKELDFGENDFLISTFPVPDSPLPAVTVSFPMTSQDVEAVSRMLNSIAKTKSMKLLEFFQESLFLRLDSPCTKEVVLKQLSGLLEKQEAVPEDFLGKVLDREDMGKTNMNELFALPHPSTPCSRKTRVAAAILNSPVKWHGDETVQLVFLLSLRLGEDEDLDNLYLLFTEIMNNLLLCKRLIKAEDFQQFTDIIGEYL